MSKGSAIVGFLLCFLGGMALMWGIDRSGGMGHGAPDIGPEGAVAMADGDWNDAAAAVPVSSKDPHWGSRTAAVTIVEYSDLQ